MSKRFWMWKPWMMLLPFPVLVWITRQYFDECVIYQDDQVQIKMTRSQRPATSVNVVKG